METNRLKQFCVVVETGNLRRAAELLGISHSGLSKSLKLFEEEMGKKLFLPSGRGLAVSDEGAKLYERSAPFFAAYGKLLGKSDQVYRDRLRLGSFEVFTSHFVGKLMHDHLSDVEIEIHELLPGRLEEALLLNRVDVGITYDPVPRKGIEYIRIAALTMAPYVLNGKFKGQDILEIPFVVPVKPFEATPSGVKGLDAWPDNKFTRKTPYRVDLLLTGLELVRQGLCAIFIPQFVARLHNESLRDEFHFEKLDTPKGMKTVKRDVFIVKRESTPEDQNIQQIAKAIRRICI